MKLKNILSNAFDAIISSYEGKRFWPSLILRLVMALASAVITAVFANTLFSKNNIVNQIFAALFFYFLMVSVSKLITEIKRGGFGKRLKTTVCNMVRLKPPALWFFIAAVVIALFLPYAFVLSLALLLFWACRLYKRTDRLRADHLHTYKPRCADALRRDRRQQPEARYNADRTGGKRRRFTSSF